MPKKTQSTRLRRTWRSIRLDIKSSVRPMLRPLAFAGALGALLISVLTQLLTPTHLAWVAIALAALTFLATVQWLWSKLRHAAEVRMTVGESELLEPTPDAERAAKAIDALISGTAVEVLPHPLLNTRTPLRELGWDPSTVAFRREGWFEPSAFLDRVGGKKEFLHHRNSPKFCLSRIPFSSEEQPDLVLNYLETDYWTIRSGLPTLKADPALRAELGSVDPAANRVPQALCLHFLVAFGSDAGVLCMRRSEATDHCGGKFSFSAEEQLRDSDLNSDEPAKVWFQRALLEEVFALSESERPHSERWAEVANDVVGLRLLSVFYEEWVCGFALCGVAQLAIDPAELATQLRRRALRTEGTREREGTLYVAAISSLTSLLFVGSCQVTSLMDPDQVVTVRSADLHPTSRYRIFRFLRARNRGPVKR